VKRRLVAVILALLAPVATRAADVTVCGASNAGGGRNLEQAVGSGGTVGIACPGSPVIEVVRTILVTRPVVIDGHFATTLRRNAAMNGPMFEVAGANSLTLGSLDVQGVRRLFLGSPGTFADVVRGPAATVNLRNVKLTQSTIPFRVASLVVADSEFRDNSVGSVVGALSIQDSRFVDSYSHFHVVGGTADIHRAIFSNNQGGALSISGTGCALRIGASRFERNGQPGPFPAVDTGCPTEMENVQFVGNKALRGAGLLITPGGASIVVRLRTATFTDNAAREYGGALAIRGAGAVNLQIRNGDFQRNTAPFGGAIATDRFMGRHELGIGRTVFQDNTASAGGGAIALRASALSLTQVAFAGNRADLGGGLYLAETGLEPVRLANVVLRDNVARKGGAAAFSGRMELANVTIVRNAGGGFVFDLDPQDLATIVAASLRAGHPAIHEVAATNSILAFNSGQACAVALTGRSNLQFPDASCGAAAQVADPSLDDMLVPIPGSPARGAGHLPACLADPVSARDFYGNPRPRSSACSIGAVEGELDRFATLLRHAFRRGTWALPWAVIEPPAEHEPDGQRLRLD
jgi:predicted outer membrane repeat protein